MASPVAATAELAPIAPWGMVGSAKKFLARRRVRVTAVLGAAIVPVHLWIDGSAPRDVFAADDLVVAIGWCLVVAGLALRSWAAGALAKQRVLATTGAYAVIRNPLYAGSCLMMSGFVAFTNGAPVFVLAAGFIVGLYRNVIRGEEKWLSRMFPRTWAAYVKAVPCFIPCRLTWPGIGQWSLACWRKNEEGRAWIGLALALAGLKIWQLCV
jgi:protein-S-isoprenylcysteine O-methyltransferase Ste14